MPRFSLAEGEVRRRQRAALSKTHPDRAADPVQRAAAVRESAAISAAARTLLDPVARAEALLRMASVDSAPPPPPELLMSTLEWREELDAARAGGDAAALAETRRPLEARLAEVLNELADAIDGDRGVRADAEPPSAADGAGPSRAHTTVSVRIADPQRAGALLTELRMFRRLLESPPEPGT